ncbi:MAG TPA: transketolase C-terminal domain-containing protein [Bacteroidales bacterium]
MLTFNSLNFRTWSKLGQRGAFFGLAIFEIVEQYNNTLVLTADLGYLSGLERFMNKYPDKFINTGIAEQNMVGISAGLAQEGHIVFATTYATFVSMRSCEQIRHYLGYMQSNVKIVGTGAGLVMGYSGNTHYTIEDFSIMRAIPNIVVISPADATESVKAALAAAEYDGPVYIRLSGALNIPMVYTEDYHFQIGKAVTLRKGQDITIFATGTMVYEALTAAKILEDSSISATVVNMHTIKPLDTSVIDTACASSKLIVTVEEHGIIGGLGGAVAEYKAGIDNAPKQLFIGLPDKFGKAGEYKYLLDKFGLTGQHIAEKIKSVYKR